MKICKVISLILLIPVISCAKTANHEWDGYIDGTVGKPLYYLYQQTINLYPSSTNKYKALSLGSGAGNEDIDLLTRGWEVTSTDSEPRSGEIISERAKYLSGVSHVYTADYKSVPLKDNYNLVTSYFALPFGDKADLPMLFKNLSAHMLTGSILSANFFGHEHSFVKKGYAYGLDKTELEALLKANHFKIIFYLHRVFEQTDYDGNRTHWDVLDFIASKI